MKVGYHLGAANAYLIILTMIALAVAEVFVRFALVLASQHLPVGSAKTRARAAGR